MTTTNMTKPQLLTLKAKIKGLATEGSRCRRFIHTSSHEKRYDHWNAKREIGLEARYHLIAYGLLRGIPYEKIEPNGNRCPFGVKNPIILYGYRIDYNYLAQICQRHCMPLEKLKWSPENIQRLINTGPMGIPAKLVKKEAS